MGSRAERCLPRRGQMAVFLHERDRASPQNSAFRWRRSRCGVAGQQVSTIMTAVAFLRRQLSMSDCRKRLKTGAARARRTTGCVLALVLQIRHLVFQPVRSTAHVATVVAGANKWASTTRSQSSCCLGVPAALRRVVTAHRSRARSTPPHHVAAPCRGATAPHEAPHHTASHH